MKPKVVYVGYYATPSETDYDRDFVPAATAKMDYLSDVLRGLGYQVEIVSAAVSRTGKPLPSGIRTLTEGIQLRLFRSPAGRALLRRVYRVLSTRLRLALHLILKTNRQDIVLVYHSKAYLWLILLARILRRFRIILEVEELYADQRPTSLISRRLEIFALRRADGYIFSTRCLSGLVNRKGAPELELLGTYEVPAMVSPAVLGDGVHVVYAGVIDRHKGAFDLLECAPYLSEQFHLHIIGFGSEDDISALIDALEQLRGQVPCKVTYDGLLHGSDLRAFLQACRVGIVAQASGSTFSNTSFPSKVLVYMSNGLVTVSSRFKALVESEVGDSIVYRTSDSPRALARAIEEAANTDLDTRECVSILDSRFREEAYRFFYHFTET